MSEDSKNILAPLYARMSVTPQSPKWHGEGDVLTHTKMVCNTLRSFLEFHDLSYRQRRILYLAAKLHDIGKIEVTKDLSGEIEAPKHAPIGSRMARGLLWRHGFCGEQNLIEIRETVCQLIRYHSFPPHAIDSDDAVLRLHRIAANSLLLPDFSIRLLCMLAKADMKGRICDDKSLMLEQIALCEERAIDEKCIDRCFRFPSDYTMRAYLKGCDVWKNQMLYDDTWGTVYMMSGLPGTGKDTWIRQNLPDIPMVSLDEIRHERKILPTDNQGLVANLAKEQAKEYLRKRQSFVWNATNLTPAMRQQLISLFEGYKARVNIIYLETDWQTLLERNRSREDAVPQSAIKSMLGKLTPPEAYEASQVDWISV